MKPHPDENYIKICCDNEIVPEKVRMAGGDVLLKWKCPSCGNRSSYKFESKNELITFENTISKE